MKLKGKFIIDKRLRDTRYLNDHLAVIQGWINHIVNISINVDYYDMWLKPSLFNVLFHQNLQNIELQLTNKCEDYFVEDIINFSDISIYNFDNKKNKFKKYHISFTKIF